ncbi:MAG: hypothetical protein O2912_06700 [Proteobacteria bacterium]|nr:hypothetical protein [Pseudomonadota bacterium]
MNLNKISLLLIAVLGLGGCEQLAKIGGEPFVTENPLNLPRADQQEYVSACYNADTTTRAQIAAVAVKACEQVGSQVKFFAHDMILNTCPVVTKARVTYLCIAPKR